MPGGARKLTVNAALDAAEAALEAAGVDAPRLTAELLIAHLLGRGRAAVFARLKDALGDDAAAEYRALVNRRAAREPLQYITGREEFLGLTLRVTPDVLIPRPETELLVIAALSFLKGMPGAKAADIGTGSGCIAAALAVGAPGLSVYATDSSAAALKVAKENAASSGVADSVLFLRGDLFGPLGHAGLEGRLDAVVSNPPYIPSAEIPHLQPEVGFEPPAALDGGPDGLDVIRVIIKEAPGFLKPGGRLFVEIGHDQAGAVRGLVAESPGLSTVEFAKDFAGIERVLVAVRE